MGTTQALLDTKHRPLVMAIVNLTPDSFYPDSRAPDPDEAVQRAQRAVEQGADIVDLGGESTRPGSEPVPEKAEHERVVPVVEALAHATDTAISVDTRRASVARACLEAGATIVNDTSAGRDDEAMRATVAEHGADIVLMHRQGQPKQMQQDPSYEDVVGEVEAFLTQRAKACLEAGIPRESIVVDPGIGFGKTLEHNLALLRATPRLAELGYPVLVGASRKSMFAKLLDREVDERLAGSLTVAAWTAAHGASVLRVHDVAETLDALRTVQALEKRP